METLVIVGVGLLGASIGLAVRRRGLAKCVVGVDPSPAACLAARNRGAVDETAELHEAVREAAVVVFCTPVDMIAQQVLAAAPLCRPGTLLTDVGSTKTGIVNALRGRLPDGVTFIGSHPLAGSEKSGPEHGNADLFVGRLVLVTPDDDTEPLALSCITHFWESLGAKVATLTPENHDRALALTSHLPHLVASALAGVLPAELVPFTATGFRDTTRLASGQPRLWSAIFAENRQPLLVALDRLMAQLYEFREAITSRDRAALEALLAEGKANRDRLL